VFYWQTVYYGRHRPDMILLSARIVLSHMELSMSHSSIYLRASQIANARATRSKPATKGLLDVSLATWHRWAAAGIAPQSIKLGPATTVWRRDDVIAFAESRAQAAAA
jgi:predicted DNA-binding transcriptional regulator AlpA